MIEGTLIAARFFAFAAISVLFGSSLFFLYGLKPAARVWPRRTLLTSAVIAIAATVAWLMAETALLGESTDAMNVGAVWAVAADTSFGRAYLLRLGLLIVAAALVLIVAPSRRLWMAQAVIGGVALASFAWSGHGTYDDELAGTVHLGADVVHLLSAGLWIGALFVLCLLIREPDTELQGAHRALEAFSGIGPAAVALLVLSGLINSWFLVGLSRAGALFTTTYGLMIAGKLVLFAMMLALAAANRFRLTPRLALGLGSDAATLAHATRALRRSVFTETVLAILVLAAVAYLGTLEPPIAAAP